MPLPRPRELDPDETPDGDDEPIATYYRERAEELFYQLELNPPTDPDLRRRLAAELDWWKREAAAATLEEHWAAGAGDRTLF